MCTSVALLGGGQQKNNGSTWQDHVLQQALVLPGHLSIKNAIDHCRISKNQVITGEH